MKRIVILISVAILTSSCSKNTIATNNLETDYNSIDSTFNLEHLNFLNEITEDEKPILITHIYATQDISNIGKYIHVDASQEGISCVDDVARSIIVYNKHYLLTNDPSNLPKVVAGLNFIMDMQQHDGEFYNFIYEDGTINKTGITSYKYFGWWGARGLWGLTNSYPIFKESDPEFAIEIKNSIEKSISRVEKEVYENYGNYNDIDGVKVPAWLIDNSGAVSGITLIALLEYYEQEPTESLKKLITSLADGLLEFQQGNYETFPYGTVPSWGGDLQMWEEYSSHQLHALIYTARILQEEKYLEASKLIADGFLTYTLLNGRMYGMNPNPRYYEQIAYGTNSYVQAFIEMYKLTDEEKYKTMASLSASWLFGENVLNENMYDEATGRGYDGLDDIQVNKNSGAESTIEALWSIIDLISIDALEDAKNFTNRSNSNVIQYLEVENGNINGHYIESNNRNFNGGKAVSIAKATTVEIPFETTESMEYLISLSFNRNELPTNATAVKISMNGEEIGVVNTATKLNTDSRSKIVVETIGKTFIEKGNNIILIESVGENENSFPEIDSIHLVPSNMQTTWTNNEQELIQVSRNINEINKLVVNKSFR